MVARKAALFKGSGAGQSRSGSLFMTRGPLSTLDAAVSLPLIWVATLALCCLDTYRCPAPSINLPLVYLPFRGAFSAIKLRCVAVCWPASPIVPFQCAMGCQGSEYIALCAPSFVRHLAQRHTGLIELLVEVQGDKRTDTALGENGDALESETKAKHDSTCAHGSF